MQCSDFQHQLDDWLDGDLPEARMDALRSHIDGCDHCRQLADRSQRLVAALRQLPAPEMPADLPERLLNERVGRGRHLRGVAIAASFFLAVSVALMVGQRDAGIDMQGASPQQWVSMAVAEPRDVRLALTAPEDLEGAVLTLELPEGVELQGHPERRQLRWTASLRKGENRLVLPLIATQRNDTELVLRIEHGNKNRVMRIGIHANGKTYSTDRVDTHDGYAV